MRKPERLLVPSRTKCSTARSALPVSAVLVAEDCRINGKIISKFLHCLGFDVDLVEDGHKALLAVSARTYAFIIMDCQMPILDGLQATAAIRSVERWTGSHIPIIGYSASATEQQCLEAGMDDFLAKPATPQLLRDKLARWSLTAMPALIEK